VYLSFRLVIHFFFFLYRYPGTTEVSRRVDQEVPRFDTTYREENGKTCHGPMLDLPPIQATYRAVTGTTQQGTGVCVHVNNCVCTIYRLMNCSDRDEYIGIYVYLFSLSHCLRST
jgi:hypothetical protein